MKKIIDLKVRGNLKMNIDLCWGGVGQTDLVMKGLEIASHHVGGGGWGVVTKGLEIPSNPGEVAIRDDHERS